MTFCELKKNERTEYEKALYQAFYIQGEKYNPWICNNYRIKDRRLTAPFPYSDLRIFCIKNREKIISAVAYNLNNDNEWQLEKLGFPLKKNPTDTEILTFFVLKNNIDFNNGFTLIPKFFNYTFEKIRESGKSQIYGTCDQRMLTMYSMQDFKDIDSITKRERQVYLLSRIL